MPVLLKLAPICGHYWVAGAVISIVTFVVLVVLPAVPVKVSWNIPVVAVVAGVAAAPWHEESDNPSATVKRIPIAYLWKTPTFRLRRVSAIKAVRSASPAIHPPKT
jgi:hypothetical protein